MKDAIVGLLLLFLLLFTWPFLLALVILSAIVEWFNPPVPVTVHSVRHTLYVPPVDNTPQPFYLRPTDGITEF
jgi:hypothetical protein